MDKDFIRRLDNSALTEADIDGLDSAKPVRPQRLYEYIEERHYQSLKNGRLWEEFRDIVPLALIDNRIIDLAVSFWENPNDKLLTGYSRLEDIVRKRTGLKEHSSKLFSQAFLGNSPLLHWTDIDDSGEQTGRANLFVNTYMAHRNPRAHKEMKGYSNNQLSEFLLLNHLYLLEKDAVEA